MHTSSCCSAEYLILVQMGVLSAHLDEQLKLYSPQTDGTPTGNLDLINLVNHQGHEGPIKEAYDKAMAEVCQDRSEQANV